MNGSAAVIPPKSLYEAVVEDIEKTTLSPGSLKSTPFGNWVIFLSRGGLPLEYKNERSKNTAFFRAIKESDRVWEQMQPAVIRLAEAIRKTTGFRRLGAIEDAKDLLRDRFNEYVRLVIGVENLKPLLDRFDTLGDDSFDITPFNGVAIVSTWKDR